jgi:hypothetical protein
MTEERDAMRIVRSWLREDEHESADRVLDVVLARLDTIPQRRSWWPAWRFAHMNTFTKFAMAAAAVVAVAIVGLNLVPGGLGPGGPTPPPTASPTTATARPSAAIPAIRTGPLAPGTYLVPAQQFSRLPFTVTVPAGWAKQDEFISKGDWIQGNGVTFATWIVSHVYADSCDWEGTLGEARTSAELLALLKAQDGHDTSGPTAVTVGGVPGSRLELSIPATFDIATCDQAFMRLWPDAGPNEDFGLPIAPGQTATVHVMDIDGQAMVVVAIRNNRTSAADAAELQGVLDSIVFLP